MVREFVKTALEGDKEDVAEHEQALLLKTFRASRSTLQLARRTARETRVTMALAAVAVKRGRRVSEALVCRVKNRCQRKLRFRGRPGTPC